MAKGDHSRAQNKIDEQQKQAQTYLTGVQGNLGDQYGRYDNLFWGSGAPNYGSTYGVGTTVPNYNPYNQPIFSGNGTDTRYVGSGQSAGAAGGGIDRNQMMSVLQRYGPASSENLQRALPELQQMYPGIRPDKSGGPLDELVYNGQVIDLISNAEGGGPMNWTFQTGGGGGGIGNYGQGGIPGMGLADYGRIGGLYESLLPQYQNLYGDLRGQFGNFIGSASNMANTGGLSEGDKANIRSRAISPIRSIYSRAQQNLDQQRAIQGGYSPGYATALSRFNRDMGQQTSDATTNAEGMIAELVQRGKLGGLGAWGSGLSGMSSGLLGALGGQVSALGGLSGLYGTQPGMARLYGDLMNNATGQQLTAAGLQNNLSNDIMRNQIASSAIPGNYQNALANIGGTIGLGGQIGGMIYPWLGGGNLPGYSPIPLGTAGGPSNVEPRSLAGAYGY